MKPFPLQNPNKLVLYDLPLFVVFVRHECAGVTTHRFGLMQACKPSSTSHISTIEDNEHTDVDITLRTALSECIRSRDSAVILPGANYDHETLSMHNVVVELDGQTNGVPIKIFNSDWGHGISLIRLSGEYATDVCETIANDASSRAACMKRLTEMIRNEVSDCEVEIGPPLSNSGNRDDEGVTWRCGFDSVQCSAGLYSTMEDVAPSNIGIGGMRSQRAYYLIVRCGCGKAAQEFHGRLRNFAANEESLDSIFESKDFSIVDDMCRIVDAGKRNRSRVMVCLARALGLETEIDTTIDNAASQESDEQTAMLHIDTVSNVLRRRTDAEMLGEGVEHRWIYYAGCVSPEDSTGIVVASTPTDGVVAFVEDPSVVHKGRYASIKNEVGGSAPLASGSMHKCNETMNKLIESYVTAIKNSFGSNSNFQDRVCNQESSNACLAQIKPHPDHGYVSSRFTWHKFDVVSNQTLKNMCDKIEPLVLWGTRRPLMSNKWAASLNLHKLQMLKLVPEIVVLSCDEPSRVKALAKEIIRCSSTKS